MEIRIKRKKTNSTRSFFKTSFDLRVIQSGEFVQLDVAVAGTEANHATLSRVVDRFTSEIRRSRETGPPEQPQREARRPPAQSRVSAAPQKITRPSQTRFFILLYLANHEHRPGHDFPQKLGRSIPVAASCVGLRGCASRPIRLKSDSLFGNAGRNDRPLAAAPRGGRWPSLASLVVLGFSLPLVRDSIFSAKCAIPG